MNDEAGFLAKICAEPEDDTHRLVFADWLDENGQPARAEFIRVQIKLAKMDAESMGPVGMVSRESPYRASSLRLRYLVRREQELLFASPAPGEANGINWLPSPLFDLLAREDRVIFPDGDRFQWRRGFVERITCTAADWLAHGDVIRAACPVTKVALTTLPDIEVDSMLEAESEIAASLMHRDSWHTFPDVPTEGLPESLLKLEWPGITFELPP